jgi:hypothetical protein
MDDCATLPIGASVFWQHARTSPNWSKYIDACAA